MIAPTEAQRIAERLRPEGAPSMLQRWAQLLFLHWTWDPATIQKTLPPGLTVDVFKGQAWVGLVPFFMEGVRPRGVPAVPGVSNFLELNVRTYVHDAQGRPGIWFYSLDCNRWLAVKLARTFFHLPYEHAAMRATVDAANGEVDYEAWRHGTPADAGSKFVYRAAPGAPVRKAEPGTLEFFLIERYRMFAQDARGRLLTGRVHHAPYRIGAAAISTWDDAMLQLAGFDRGDRSPEHTCLAQALDVEIWPMEPVAEPIRKKDDVSDGLAEGAVVPV